MNFYTEWAEGLAKRLIALDAIAQTLPPRQKAYEEEILAIQHEIFEHIRQQQIQLEAIQETQRQTDALLHKQATEREAMQEQAYRTPAMALCARCGEWLASGIDEDGVHYEEEL